MLRRRRWGSRWLCSAIYLDSTFHKLLNLLKLQRLLDAEARLESRSSPISSLFLHLRYLITHLFDGFLADPASHNFRPTVAFQISDRW